jgi:hypothetical protein
MLSKISHTEEQIHDPTYTRNTVKFVETESITGAT